MLRQYFLYSNLFDFSNHDAVCNRVLTSPRGLTGRESFYPSFVYSGMKTLARTLLITLFLSFFSQNAVAAVLEKVTNQRLGDGQEVINLFFTGHSEPKIFSLDEGSPRLVFDFPDTRYLGQPKVVVDSSGVLRGIRISTHENPLKTRVVFDLRDSKIDYSQKFLEDGHTLQISLPGKDRTPLPKAATAPTAPQKTEQPIIASAPVKAGTATPPPTEPKAAQPSAVAPPAQKETLPPQKTESPAKSPIEPSLATAEKSQTVSAAGKPATSSPFDSPFGSTESPAKPAEKAGSAATAPPATQVLDYSLMNQPAGGDVLRLQLDGYASPEITAHEGRQPQLVCFFPKMSLAVKKGKGTYQSLSGKFVRKVTATTQEKPSGVKIVLDLEGGYDYYVQQIFNTDESAFFLVVNVQPLSHGNHGM